MTRKDVEPLVLQDSWQEGIAEDARANGFINIYHLAFILAKDVQYNEKILPSLWYDFELYKRGPAEPDMSIPGVRINSWLAILNRWAIGTIAGFHGELVPIPLLAIHNYDDKKRELKEYTSGRPYVTLEDIKEYFRKVVRIPLPILLFSHWEEDSAPAIVQETSTIEYSLMNKGPVWTIVFEGKQTDGLRGKGFLYLHYLVSRPNQSFPVIELLALDGIDPENIDGKLEDDTFKEGEGWVWTEGDFHVGTGLNKEKLSILKENLESLKEEYEDALASGDEKCASEIDNKKEKLENYIREQHFAAKPKLKSNIKRICNMLGMRITRAIDQVGKYDPRAGEHFAGAIDPFTNELTYRPARRIDWTF